MHTSAVTRVCLLAMTFAAASVSAAEMEIMLPMSDGVRLATSVWLPEGDGPFPAVLARGPYHGRKSLGPNVSSQFNSRGYALVWQDVRGRFESEGEQAIIFAHEGLGEHRDGHETIAWIAQQPWSDGNVGGWGGSALGITENMAAPGAPAAWKGQFVMAAFSRFYHTAYPGGVWRKSLFEGWLKSTGILEGNLETFLAHPYRDDFWKSIDAVDHADRVNTPGIYAGGWYDIFLQGTIDSFVSIQEQGGPLARGRNRLVIGPLGHGIFFQLRYPPNSREVPIDIGVPFDYYDHWLKGEDNQAAKDKAVHYYVMGDTVSEGAPGNFWRSVDRWPPRADVTPFYFHADGALARGAAPVSGDAKKSFNYDPANPVMTVGGQNLAIPLGPMDQSIVENRDDVLLFTSEVLEEPLEVTGRITARLFVSSDCPDTDFTVKLTDVYPDGRSMLVTDGIHRVSLRNGFEKPQFLEPGEVYEVEVDLWSTSLIFNKGHRIRVAVSSSNAPRYEPNANTGAPHPVEGETRVARNSVHLSKDHASRIELPVYVAD